MTYRARHAASDAPPRASSLREETEANEVPLPQHAAPETMLPALRSDGGFAPLPPSTGSVGLPYFFGGLAAGEDMTSLIQSLRRTVLGKFCGEERESSTSVANTAFASLDREEEVSRTACPSTLDEAVRAAMLLSTEHPSAADEATFLYHSPSTHTCLAHDHRSTRARPFPVNSTRVRALLSDKAAVLLAKRCLREQQDVGKALDLLREVEPTASVCAMLVECYSKKNDWLAALRSLEAIPPQLWTEMDLAHVARAAYHASLSHGREPLSKGAPAAAAEEVARVLRTAHVHGVSWSSPAALNDALGLLSMGGAQWPMALKLLDMMFPSLRSSTTETLNALSAVSGTKGGRGPRGIDSTPKPVNKHSLAGESYSSETRFSAPATRYLRPNAVTVFQTCRALRARPDLAFQTASALVATYDIDVSTDTKAMEAFLQTCVRERQWVQALHTLQRATSESSSPGRDSAEPRLLSAELLVSVLKLLGEGRATQHYAEALPAFVSSTSAYARGDSTGGARRDVSGGAAPRHTPAWALSKFYNADTVSRAYNTMIQHATSAAEAEAFYQDFQEATRRGKPSTPDKEGTEGSEGNAGVGDDTSLENESYERMSLLYAEAGDWVRALGCLNLLLHHPQRQCAYIPTTKVHDAVQYALEQSSHTNSENQSKAEATGTPQAACVRGAPWQLSVTLFYEMCDRDVPTSPVAFQSVVKKCFSQGASEQAQRLFQVMLKRGVRR